MIAGAQLDFAGILDLGQIPTFTIFGIAPAGLQLNKPN